jgi:uncharacterized protein (UPF0332 family)
MPDWRLWRDMARESIQAARTVHNVYPRSAISRYNYAAFQAATAWLLYSKQQPPDMQGAWSHAETPELLREKLSPAIRSTDVKRDIQIRLRELYKLRCDADYVSEAHHWNRSVEKARKDASYISKVIEDNLPE